MKALILGAGGQDGSYLAELLLEEGAKVVAIARGPLEAYPHLAPLDVEFVRGDAGNPNLVGAVLEARRPDEVYNLAAPSFVPPSWDQPIAAAASATVAANVLAALWWRAPKARLVQASSSELFGAEPLESPQNEETPLAPSTPYGAAKAHSHLLVGAYRRRYGIHASSAILFNHESPRRRPEFLPRKVSIAAARISLGLERELALGNLDARRDWGWAPDYVRAMREMARRDEPGDLVVASGVHRSVESLARKAFEVVGLDWRDYVVVDESLVRTGSELRDLVGDPRRVRTELGWEPRVGFDQMIRRMVEADLERERS